LLFLASVLACWCALGCFGKPGLFVLCLGHMCTPCTIVSLNKIRC
jgi:hypothetical protein